MDDMSGSTGGSRHSDGWISLPNTKYILESTSTTSSRPSLRLHKRHTLGTLPTCRQICRRALSPHNRRSEEPIQPLAILGHPPRACRPRAHTTLLPTPRAQARLNQCSLPPCFLRLQHNSHPRRTYLLQANRAPLNSTRLSHSTRHSHPPFRRVSTLLAPLRRADSAGCRTKRTSSRPWVRGGYG